MGIISGSFTGQKTGSYGVDVDWSAETVTESNVSRLTAQVYANYYSIDIGANLCTCTVDGVTKTATAPALHHSGSNVRRLIATFTFDVPHNSDGSKPQCNISASFAYNLTSGNYGYIGTLSVSGTVALETIPRASAFTYVPQTVELGSVCYFKWVPASAAFRYQLEFILGGNHAWTVILHPNTTSEYTHIDTLVLDHFARWITGNPPRLDATVILHTYSDSGGTNEIGSVSASLTIVVPENSATKPSVDISVSTKDSPIEGMYIMGKSGLDVSFRDSAPYEAWITGRAITVNGAPYDGLAKLAVSGYASVKGTVTDSRGFTQTDEEQIYVHYYRKPRVTGFACFRCNGDSEPQDDGSYICIRATREYEILGGNNHCTLYYRLNGGAQIELLGANEETDSAELLLDGFLSTESYVIEVQAVDDMDTGIPAAALIPTADVDFHLREGGKGAAFGGYAEEEDLLDVLWRGRFRQYLAADAGVNDVEIRALKFNRKNTLTVNAPGRGIGLVALMGNWNGWCVYVVGNYQSDNVDTVQIAERIAGTLDLTFEMKNGQLEIGYPHATEPWAYGWYIRNLHSN